MKLIRVAKRFNLRLDIPMLLLLASIGVLFLPHLFTHGIFLDGALYGAISNNLSLGHGEMWLPFYRSAEPDGFVDHPPFFFWVEAGWFSLFGNAFYSERVFSLILLITCLFGVNRILKLEGLKQRTRHFILNLWLVIPVVFWTFRNNMMEMLLTVQIIVAFTILLKRYVHKRSGYDLLLVAIIAIAGILTKGPVACAIFMIPLVFIPRFGNQWKLFVRDSLLILALMSAGMGIILLYEPAYENLSQWFDAQFLGVLNGRRKYEYGARTKMLWTLIQQLLIPMLLGLIFMVFGNQKMNRVNKKAIPYLLTGFLFSLPFLISGKQHDYYIAPSFFGFVIFMGMMFQKHIEALFNTLNRSRVSLWIRVSLVVVIVSMVGYGISRYGDFSRQQTLLSDLQKINNYAGNCTELKISHELIYDWSMHAYAMRYYGYSLLTDGGGNLCISRSASVEGFVPVAIDTEEYHLHKKNL